MADEKDLEVPENAEAAESSSSEPEEAVAQPDESAAPAEDAAASSEAAEAPGESAEDTPPADDPAPDDDSAPVDSQGATPSADEILAEAGAAEAESPEADAGVVNEADVPEGDAEAAMLAMLEELPEDGSGATPDDINFDAASVSKAEFQQLSAPAGKPETQNIDMLLDVNLPVSIELGRTRMSISDILSLGPGSVVELNKLAGEPVDLLVNYKIVARGEVVVIDENFGVRVTNLISPTERLKALGEDQ
jgi:flagellar motor switch protein FliN/FliY